jgi:chloride channel protein, CIC family
MTRDYDLVTPSIVAVALAIGIRRLLSVENIYTIKLVGRGHFVPKAMHANMFLVRRARDIMLKDVTFLSTDAHFDAFLRQHSDEHGLRYVVVTHSNRIVGVVRINTSFRHGIEHSYDGVRLGDVAQRGFTIARESDIMFDVVQRMTRRDAVMAIVIKDGCRGRPADVVGMISKDQIADSVGASIRPFG